MGPSTIGGSNFPITIALVGWSGFSFDLFDSTYPDSLFISHDCVCACACALSCPNIEATGHRWIWLVDHDKAERSQRGIALRCENLRHQGGGTKTQYESENAKFSTQYLSLSATYRQFGQSWSVWVEISARSISTTRLDMITLDSSSCSQHTLISSSLFQILTFHHLCYPNVHSKRPLVGMVDFCLIHHRRLDFFWF